MISPNQFICHELLYGTTAKDYEDLCIWLLVNNIENPTILDVASNGTDFFDFDFKKKIILDSAGINNLSLAEKTKLAENFLKDEYYNNPCAFREMVSKMARIRNKTNEKDEWFALDETLDYYLNNGMGSKFYELDGNPIEAAIELLKKIGELRL